MTISCVYVCLLWAVLGAPFNQSKDCTMYIALAGPSYMYSFSVGKCKSTANGFDLLLGKEGWSDWYLFQSQMAWLMAFMRWEWRRCRPGCCRRGLCPYCNSVSTLPRPWWTTSTNHTIIMSTQFLFIKNKKKDTCWRKGKSNNVQSSNKKMATERDLFLLLLYMDIYLSR